MPYMVAANGLACSHRSWNRSARSRASVIEPSMILRRKRARQRSPVRPDDEITKVRDGYYRFRYRRQAASDGGPVDPETVDQNYAQLQQQAQQTAAQIQTLAGKLQAAAAAGDPNAREWMLDLKEITLGVQQEQGQGGGAGAG